MRIVYSRLFNRWLWRQCHVYLALLFGLLFALLGLTGSLNVYRQSIDELLNPRLLIQPADKAPLPLDQLMNAIKRAHPNRHGAWTLELPSSPEQCLTAWFEKPAESVDKRYAPLMVAVNPYSGEIVASRFWGETFTTWIMDLHTDLQLQLSNRFTLATLATLLMLSLSSGWYLWWPGFSGLRNQFKIRCRSLMGLLFDLHRLLGAMAAPLLMLLAFTGFHLAYPQLLETLTAAEGMGHGDGGPNVRSTAIPNNRPISIAEAVLVARGLFPSSEVRRVTTPAGEIGTYRINLRQKHELNQHHPFTNVWIDRWSGQIRAVNNPNQFSAGQTFTTWQWPLHTGEAFGAWGRGLWFFCGLLPSFLYVSGVLHWLHRQGLLDDRRIDLGQSFRRSGQWAYGHGRHCGLRLWQALYPLALRAALWLRRPLR